jgi:single-strand DNA-binding protein
MPNFNRVILAGHITRDLELRTIPNGTVVLDFSIAVNEKYKDKETTHFIDCTAWAKTAEIIAQYHQKGDAILIEGKLQQERFPDKDGKQRSKHKVRVDDFTFLKTRDKGQNAAKDAPKSRPAMSGPSFRDEVQDEPESVQDEIPF